MAVEHTAQNIIQGDKAKPRVNEVTEVEPKGKAFLIE